MQNVVRECRHEHGVGPTENSDHGKKQKNGQGARMIPHVTKSLQRLAEDPSRCFHWKMLRQPHHQETDDDCDEADSIDKKQSAIPTCAIRTPASMEPSPRLDRG